MREIILSKGERLEAAVRAADNTASMDEESFQAFYENTARALWSYLSRVSGDAALADDLLQDSYYHFLRAGRQGMSEAHGKNYLFRIATNLMRDHWRRGRTAGRLVLKPTRAPADTAERVQVQSDVWAALKKLKPRERELLWLAYVEGFSHKQIAEAIGLKAESIRLLVFRARQKLAALLRKSGLGPWADDGDKH
jgi:RNA polymerase sigma-70 factor, ECF subfamily